MLLSNQAWARGEELTAADLEVHILKLSELLQTSVQLHLLPSAASIHF